MLGLRAVRDPESLVEIIDDQNPSDEGMLYVAREAYEARTGRELPDPPRTPSIPNVERWPADRIAPRVKWNDAFYAANFPKLYALHFADRPKASSGEIERARFFEILAGPRSSLPKRLAALSTPDLIGFDRWLQTYNQALMRNDVRAASRILLGDDDVETCAGFRGWLIFEGERAIATATHDLDSLLEVARQPILPFKDLIFSTMRAFEGRSTYRGALDDDERMPLETDWAPDIEGNPSVAHIRERFPKLTAKKTDVELGAPAPRPPRAASRPTPPAAPPPPTRARHAKFGEGRIVERKEGSEPTHVVEFAAGRKTIAARFLELLD